VSAKWKSIVCWVVARLHSSAAGKECVTVDLAVSEAGRPEFGLRVQLQQLCQLHLLRLCVTYIVNKDYHLMSLKITTQSSPLPRSFKVSKSNAHALIGNNIHDTLPTGTWPGTTVCICVCMYVCMYIMCICVYMYLLYVCLYVCMCVCIYDFLVPCVIFVLVLHLSWFHPHNVSKINRALMIFHTLWPEI
jgi:hypothetical protein